MTEPLNIKTHVNGHCISTVRLRVEHSWGGEDGGYWYETYIFPSDGAEITEWIEEWGVRYKLEGEARAGHDLVVAQVECGELP